MAFGSHPVAAAAKKRATVLYRVLGLNWQSEIAFPELQEVPSLPPQHEPSDIVQIRVGSVPEALPGETRLSPWIAFEGRTCLYTIPEVGRMLVEDGRRITVDKESVAELSDLRTYLLGTGLGTVIHQRGKVPLHVGAVLSPQGVIAFTGESGAGKSTIVAEIGARLGWPVVGDDLAVLTLDAGRPMLEGGVRRLRLWADALDRLGWSKDGLVRDTQRADKFVSYAHGRFIDGPHPLVALYEIRPDAPEAAPVKLHGAQKFTTLLGAIYRPYLVQMCNTRKVVHNTCIITSQRIACWQGGRPDLASVTVLLDQAAKSC